MVSNYNIPLYVPAGSVDAYKAAKEWKRFTNIQAAYDSGKCGENVTYSFVSSTGTLTISGTGDMNNCASLKDMPWNAYCSSIKKVVINNGVTSIGSCTFYDCTGLTSVTIPNSVTSIESSAFDSCRRLEKVYYGGTAEEWAALTVDSGNAYLADATRYYYSESEPTVTGNYWHYDENGEPSAW